jgi:hypothetical protein
MPSNQRGSSGSAGSGLGETPTSSPLPVNLGDRDKAQQHQHITTVMRGGATVVGAGAADLTGSHRPMLPPGSAMSTPPDSVDVTALSDTSSPAESPLHPPMVHEELERLNALAVAYEKALAVNEDKSMREELSLLRMWRHCLKEAVKRNLSDELTTSLRDALTEEINRRSFFDARIKTELEYLNPANGTVIRNVEHKKEALLEAQEVEMRRRRAWDKAWERTDLATILDAAAAANDGVHEEDAVDLPKAVDLPTRRPSWTESKTAAVMGWAMRGKQTGDAPGSSSGAKSPKSRTWLPKYFSSSPGSATPTKAKAKPRRPTDILTASRPDDGPLPPHLHRLLGRRLQMWKALPISVRVKHKPCGRACVLIRGDCSWTGHRCEHTKNRSIYKFLASLDHEGGGMNPRKQTAPVTPPCPVPARPAQAQPAAAPSPSARRAASGGQETERWLVRSARPSRGTSPQNDAAAAAPRRACSHSSTFSSPGRPDAMVLGYTDV